MPRSVRKRRKAPVTAVSTTSLRLPPSFLRICLISAIGVRCQSKRRCGPIGPLIGVSEADDIVAPSVRATAPSRVWISRRASVALSTKLRKSRTASKGIESPRQISSRSSSAPVGAGRGT